MVWGSGSKRLGIRVARPLWVPAFAGMTVASQERRWFRGNDGKFAKVLFR